MSRYLAALALFACVAPVFAQNPLSSMTFGGSGNDSINGAAMDPSGNIYVVGTTSSFDLPQLNPYQAANSGTQLVLSANSGAIWTPVSSPFPNLSPLQPISIAADPTNSSKLYLGFGSDVCSSTDGGHHFQCVSLPIASSQTTISSLAIDPHQPSIVYASASLNGGVFKSIDGGQTWSNASQGLPSNGFINSVTLDPFHENILYAWAGSGGYVSQDAGATWTMSTLPWPTTTSVGSNSIHFTFDPVVPGIIYGPGYVGTALVTQKSTDGGQTWTQLTTPFTNVCCVVPDPKTSGVLYAFVQSAVWKSVDGGNTWNSTSVPSAASGPLTIDPNNPQVILASPYRSVDGGATWTPMTVSRTVQPSFSPSVNGQVYAIAPITSDAFLAKFQPDGKTLVFATYFGGMGNESGSSIALDPSGNIWIAGGTTSVDFPATPGSFQGSLQGSQNGFLAKFTADGKLSAATYIGGSSSDAAGGIAMSPQGNPWVIGSWTSTDFPFAAPPPAILNSSSNGFLAELDSAASRLLYAAPVDGYFDQHGKGIAVDPAGNVTVAGSTYDPNFPISSGTFHQGKPSTYDPKAFVIKTDPSGKLIYSTLFGGSHLAPEPPNHIDENEQDLGVAVAVDAAGNAYIAGYTSASDFPVTSGAYQSQIHANCPFPAFSNDTGTIGTLNTYVMGDSFVVKLDPLGQTELYSTYIGGSCYDHPTGIALDNAGNAYVAGETDSLDYPLVSPVAAGPATTQFASFVSALNPSGSALTFSTYLYAGAAPSLAASSNGLIVAAGSTGAGAQSTPNSSFVDPFPTIATDGYLATIQIPASASALTLTQIANAFSLLGGAVAPGEILALTVPSFNPAQALNIGINVVAPLTANLGGVQVFFDGVAAYVMSVVPGQIVCIAPLGIAGQQSTAIRVSVNGALSNVLNAPVSATALGLLSADNSGTGLANARNADGTLNTAENPAQAGSNITVYFTGAGVTSPAEMDGVVPTTSNIAPAATITGFGSGLGSVHALAGFVPGIFSYTVSLPANLGKQQLGITLNSTSSQSQNLYIYVN